MKLRLTTTELHVAALAAATPATHALTTNARVPLSVSILDGKVETAAFPVVADSVANAFFELYCQTIEGLPLEEAAAHAASYVVHHLAPNGWGESGGIAQASTAHPALADAEAMLRRLSREHRLQQQPATIDAAEYLAVPATWLKSAPEERLATLRHALATGIASGTIEDCGLAIDSLSDDIRGRPVRVTITHPPNAALERLPSLLFVIEQHLREQIMPWLEIYAEEREDRNKLRRTVLVDHRKTER